MAILTRVDDTLTPERAAERLRGLSADVRGAVLLDAAGSLRGASDDTATERAAIEAAVERYTGAAPLTVAFRDGEQGRVALVTVSLPGDQPLPSAHRHAGAIEEAVRERCPSLADVIVHTEPMGAETT